MKITEMLKRETNFFRLSLSMLGNCLDSSSIALNKTNEITDLKHLVADY